MYSSSLSMSTIHLLFLINAIHLSILLPNKSELLHVFSTSLFDNALEEARTMFVMSNFSFFNSVSKLLENYSPNLTSSSANSFIFKESKICGWGKGYRNLDIITYGRSKSSLSNGYRECLD